MSKPRIHIIGTGGTIAGVQRSQSAEPSSLQNALKAYDAAVVGVDALLQALDAQRVQQLRERFDFTHEQLVNIDSKDMNPQVWWQLALCLQSLAGDATVQGVVITHGTDTLEETSFFIECLRQSGAFKRVASTSSLKIIFTAAMRPSDAADADGPQNLLDALQVASDERVTQSSVMCVLHSHIHSALAISKRHSTALDAFTSAPHAAMGGVTCAGGVNVNNDAIVVPQLACFKAVVNSLLHSASQMDWPWVSLVISHAGVDARMVSTLIDDEDLKGIVIAATGNGTLSKTLLAPLRAARDKGIAVLRATRVWQGGVQAFEGDEFAACEPLSAVKARVWLMLSLTDKAL